MYAVHMMTQTRAYGSRRTYVTGTEITKVEWIVTVRTPGQEDITRAFATEQEADAEIQSIKDLMADIDWS